VRLRSFNAIGNPNGEVAQRNVGAVLTNPTSGVFVEDRWLAINGGALSLTMARVGTGTNYTLLPNTNFTLSNAFFRITLTTSKPTLAATDNVAIRQSVEGCNLRELISDVHSVSLLVRSSVSGLRFGLMLADIPSTRSLSKLCTLGAANTLTLITLPNLPIWPSAGNFSPIPGVAGYYLYVVLCAGSSNTPPANDTWQTAFFPGALGQDNFAANVANSTFDLAFVQHEPGAVCSTLIDKPFTQNYDECLRYYCKSYDYGTAVGATGGVQGYVPMYGSGGQLTIYGYAPYPKPMAKVPTMVIYNHSSGAINNVNDSAGTAHAVSSVAGGTRSISAITMATAIAANGTIFPQYTADTGW
jgi:hypothetical protein